MVFAVVAACAVLAACGLALAAVRRSRQEAERRLAVVLERIDGHLQAISASVEESVGRIVENQRERLRPLTLDFDELVQGLAEEAAARTGADAVLLRVEGPGGRPLVATVGDVVDEGLGERTLAPPGVRAFRAATVEWFYSTAAEPDGEPFHSALVAPLAPAAGLNGTLVAYSTAPNAFRAEHTAAVNGLLAEVAVGLANARRFADVEARLLLDPETGVTNRRGYELQLGREVARASRTGRPLSVVFVGIPNGSETATTGGNSTTVGQLARLLTRVTRRSDISCRRGDRQFAILLPETRAAGASVVTTRLREEAVGSLGERETIAAGHVEWQPDESVEALEARVDAALAFSSGVRPLASPTLASRPRATTHPAPPTNARDVDPTEALRRDVLESVAQEILAARRHGRSLAVVALAVEGLAGLSERDRESADTLLGRFAKRLSESVGGGPVLRLGATEFVLVLSGATADDAEALLGSLHAQSDTDDLAGFALTAGVTELVERDGSQTALARAEHALWQARQAGPGTVVVAVPGRRAPRFD